jgi:hypothetical protein
VGFHPQRRRLTSRSEADRQRRNGDAGQGTSVALSADGNTSLIGGVRQLEHGSGVGFTRSGSTWTQQGTKLMAPVARLLPNKPPSPFPPTAIRRSRQQPITPSLERCGFARAAAARGVSRAQSWSPPGGPTVQSAPNSPSPATATPSSCGV